MNAQFELVDDRARTGQFAWDKLLGYMNKCWSEAPDGRPPFSGLRKVLDKLWSQQEEELPAMRDIGLIVAKTKKAQEEAKQPKAE